MVIKLILTAGLLASFLFTWGQAASTRLLRLVMGFLTLFGIYLVWFPDHTMTIAHWVGVGRGTDLLTYLWIVVSILFIVILHLRINRLMGMVTELNRHLALRDARRPDPDRPEGS